MDLVLELLDWASGKDLAELYYENRSNETPVIVRLTFGAGAGAGAKRMVTLHSPGIGKVTFLDKAKAGAAIEPQEVLGFVESSGERAEIRASIGGKIVEVLASSDAAVSFGQPLFVVEVA